MIWIDTILKHVKTWNQNMTKYSKIWENSTKQVQDNKAFPLIAVSNSSDQKSTFDGLSGTKLLQKLLS